MINYIRELIKVINYYSVHNAPEAKTVFGSSAPDFGRLLKGFVEELDRLDPRDFEPSARCDFVVHRASMHDWSENPPSDNSHAIRTAAEIDKLLDRYAGEGTRAQTREFAFVTDLDIRKIMERDYRELTLRAFPDGAWKSTVILAGSILEAALYDRLTRDTNIIQAAMASPNAPNRPRWAGGGTKDITRHDRENEWSLDDMIKVACTLGILPYINEQAVHLALRKFRNLVHPRAELALGNLVSEGHATTSKGMVDVILDYLAT